MRKVKRSPTKRSPSTKASKQKSSLPRKNEMIELNKTLPRAKEEEYLVQFSTTHHNAVLLIVLCATFIVQGVLRYLETMNRLNYVKPWFVMVLLALMFLITSVATIILSSVLAPLKFKRGMGLLSFFFFVGGFILFFASLIFLLFII
ncbi:MAG: hypothetical protein ACOCUR_01190 [Nanoarchaeota archaeon]